MSRVVVAFFLSALMGLGLTTTTRAQTEAEFIAAFAGDWQVFDPGFATNGERCRFSFKETPQDGHYALENHSCAAGLAEVSRWAIVEAQMILLDDEEIVVTLGGNQRRMSGSIRTGAPVILERVGSPGMIDVLRAAREASGCYYLGFTDQCAPEAALASPLPDDRGEIGIQVLVNLNVRSEARDDAPLIGVVPAQSCIVAEVCATASDGVWCRAGFGDRAGWLRKLALRQNRWPVVTYTNGCTQD